MCVCIQNGIIFLRSVQISTPPPIKKNICDVLKGFPSRLPRACDSHGKHKGPANIKIL